MPSLLWWHCAIPSAWSSFKPFFILIFKYWRNKHEEMTCLLKHWFTQRLNPAVVLFMAAFVQQEDFMRESNIVLEPFKKKEKKKKGYPKDGWQSRDVQQDFDGEGGTWEIWKGTLEKVDCLSKRALENGKKKKQRAECIVVLWILWGSKSCVAIWWVRLLKNVPLKTNCPFWNETWPKLSSWDLIHDENYYILNTSNFEH